MNQFFPAIAIGAAVVFLSFTLGSFTTFFEYPPSGPFRNGFKAAKALYAQNKRYVSPYKSNLWNLARTNEVGVTRYDPDQAYNGLTLYTSGHGSIASLVSMKGEVVYEWEYPFRKAWPVVKHLDYVAGDDFIVWRNAWLFSNGDLLAIYCGEGVTPSGHGLVKIDKDSNLIWKYSEAVHHDVDVGPDGRVYTLIYKLRPEGIPEIPDLEPPILDDSVVILSPDGEELDRIDVLQAINDSPYQDILKGIPIRPLGDYLHTNSVDVVTEEIARIYPFTQAGQILISMREIAAIALLDPDTHSVVWAIRGPWVSQHDPDMLPNGSFMIFDNMGNLKATEGYSRVIEFDPVTLTTEWKYTGKADEPFHSRIRSGQQRLLNGNTLITESTSGRLFEVTRDEEIVWEYNNPVRGGKDNEYVAVVMGGRRYTPESLHFLNSAVAP